MISTSVIIPTRDNDGLDFPQHTFDGWEDAVTDIFGGFTKSATEGAWKDKESGRTYRDKSWRYQIGLDSWTQVPSLLKLTNLAAAQFRQEAMFLEIAGVPEVIRPE